MYECAYGSERYCIYAKRKNENYSIWTTTNLWSIAIKQIDKIKDLGFKAKVYDRLRGNTVVFD